MSAPPRPAAHAADLLARSVERGRLGHAYLFVGDDAGVLEDAALTLAQRLTCTTPEEARRPCGHCSACVRTASLGHPDVTWVRPGKKSRILSIDQIRDITQRVSLRPTEARHKIAILTATERLRVDAANAFLKTLEEPPRDSIFVLLTLDVDRVLETILSRCLRLNFASGTVRIAPEVADWLSEFTGAVTAASSSLMDRYRLIESLLKALDRSREQVEDALAAASPLKRYADADAAQRDRWEEELEAATEAEYRRRRADFLAGIHAWLRDIWVAAAGAGAAEFLPQFAEASRQIAGKIGALAARNNLDAWERTQRLLEGTNAQESLVLEVGILRLSL